MEEIKRMIVITDCMECPKIGECGAWKKLTPKQRFTLKTGVGVGKFILKDCPLQALEDGDAFKGCDSCEHHEEGLICGNRESYLFMQDVSDTTSCIHHKKGE